jgi:hypothetical protein
MKETIGNELTPLTQTDLLIVYQDQQQSCATTKAVTPMPITV